MSQINPLQNAIQSAGQAGQRSQEVQDERRRRQKGHPHPQPEQVDEAPIVSPPAPAKPAGDADKPERLDIKA